MFGGIAAKTIRDNLFKALAGKNIKVPIKFVEKLSIKDIKSPVFSWCLFRAGATIAVKPKISIGGFNIPIKTLLIDADIQGILDAKRLFQDNLLCVNTLSVTNIKVQEQTIPALLKPVVEAIDGHLDTLEKVVIGMLGQFLPEEKCLKIHPDKDDKAEFIRAREWINDRSADSSRYFFNNKIDLSE